MRLGRENNQPTWTVKAISGYRTIGADVANHNDGNIHMYCGVSSDDVLIYFDGELLATHGDGGTSHGYGSIRNFYIGAENETDGEGGQINLWDGKISAVMGWARPLSDAEIYELYKMGPNIEIYSNLMDPPFYGAISPSASTFNAGWATNSNQVL
jgi:hypothetical protein